MNRKLLTWGMAVAVFGLNVVTALGQSYEFAVVSNSVTAGINLNAVANNQNVFVCAGSQDSPILSVNTNNFASFETSAVNGGYLLYSNAWTKSPKNYWFNSVASQPNGFIACGTSNAVYLSSDGVTWNPAKNVLPAGDQAYASEGITYNPGSATYAAALAVYEAYYTANPTIGWTQANLPSESFAESFRSVTPFAGNNIALCGILGDIRISTNGGQTFNVSKQADLNFPSLLSVASDETNWTSQPNGTNLVCVGVNSLIEVSTNGGPNAAWKIQTQFNIGTSGSVTNFNAVTYGSAANAFLAAGTVGADGLIVMAPEVPNGGNWTWTRQTSLWSLENGTFVENANALSGRTIYGASFANTNFFQGIAMLVGNNGTIVVGGLPPLAPGNLYGNFVTNVLSEPQVNNPLGTNNNANVVTDANHPASVLTMDWYSAPTNGVELATNSFICQPPAKYYSICGEFTNWAFGRDLRTGFASAKSTPFVFTIIPPAPTNAAVGVTNIFGSSDTRVWVDVFVDPINTNFVVNWYSAAQGSNSLDYLNNGTETKAGNQFFHTPTNEACGVYTIWAETMATNTPPFGGSLVSSNRTPVTFVVIPGQPTSPVNETNCANILPPNPLAATVPAGQEINWYNVQSGGIPLTTGSTFTPPVTSPGLYTYWAEAQDIASGLVSSNRTAVILQVNPLPLAPAIVTAQAGLLTAPYQTNSALTVSVANSSFVGNPVTVDWYLDAGGLTNAYSATNTADPNWLSGGGVIQATNTLVFIPTNRLCGTYTYFARARVIDRATCNCLDCVSTNLTPVTFTLLPPAPTDAILNLTNVLTGAVQNNTPIWVDLLTNADNPSSSLGVNWYSASNGVGNINNGGDTELGNRFFHTPTNALCGVFTNWAETVATGSGGPVASADRIPVVFEIIPATPTALGAFDQTNCVEVPVPTFTVAVTNGQTANWYAVPSSGSPVTNGLNFTPTNSLAGTWEFAAEAVDPVSGLASTGAVSATLSLYNCTNALAISLNPGAGTGTIQWPGNLTLLSTTNLTPPAVWTSVSTGSMFLAPNTLTFTNTNPPTQFFRLTN